MSESLENAIARMRARQPDDWIKSENQVSLYIADLPEGSRVLCRGMVRTRDRDLPAALLYSSKSDDVAAVAFEGTRQGIALYGPSLFWPNVPYESIAREVLAGPETTALAAAARQGGDVEQAPAESPQSGGEAATPKVSDNPRHLSGDSHA